MGRLRRSTRQCDHSKVTSLAQQRLATVRRACVVHASSSARLPVRVGDARFELLKVTRYNRFFLRVTPGVAGPLDVQRVCAPFRAPTRALEVF